MKPGERAETALHAIVKRISVCIFLLCCHLNTDSAWSDKKVVWRARWKCPFKEQKIFVLLSKFANSHNSRILRPKAGTEWGKLAAAASAPSVLGKTEAKKCVSQCPECMQNPTSVWCQWAEASTASGFSAEATRHVV